MVRTTAILLLGVVFLAGCNSDQGEVSGTVLLGEQPLKEGQIIFEEVDKSKTPVGAQITDGKYSAKVPPGSKVVRISASRPSGKIDPVMGPVKEEMIAVEFNEKTTLKAEIKAGGNPDVDFSVKPRPQGK